MIANATCGVDAHIVGGIVGAQADVRNLSNCCVICYSRVRISRVISPFVGGAHAPANGDVAELHTVVARQQVGELVEASRSRHRRHASRCRTSRIAEQFNRNVLYACFAIVLNTILIGVVPDRIAKGVTGLFFKAEVGTVVVWVIRREFYPDDVRRHGLITSAQILVIGIYSDDVTTIRARRKQAQTSKAKLTIGIRVGAHQPIAIRRLITVGIGKHSQANTCQGGIGT